MNQLLKKKILKDPGKKKKERAERLEVDAHTEFGKWSMNSVACSITVLALVFVSSVLALLGPIMIGNIIDTHIIPMQFDGLGGKIGLLIAIYFGLSSAMYFQNFWMVGIAQQTVFRLRTSLFAHLQKLPVTFFDKRQHGELMSRVTNDIENVSQTLNSSFIQVFSSVLTLTGTFAVMLYLSPF